MSIDPIIESAIKQATEENGQDAQVATKIISWFSELSAGNESIDEKSDYERRISSILNTLP